MKRILITGGSGRLAGYMIPKLAQHYQVVIFDTVAPQDQRYMFIQGDITQLEDLVSATKGIDSIVHLAAIPLYTGEDAKIWRINVDGTFNVLEASKINKVKNIIYTSSVCAWGVIFKSVLFTPSYLPIDEKIPDLPDDMYGMGKLIGEHLCRTYSSRYGLNCIALRLATVLLDDPIWKEAVENIDNPGYQFKLIPSTLRDFMWQYVDPRDLADAYLSALKAVERGKVSFDIYNIAARDVFSNTKTVELIRNFLPDIKIIKNTERFLDDEYASLVDISKARKELGFNPKFTWRDFNPS